MSPKLQEIQVQVATVVFFLILHPSQKYKNHWYSGIEKTRLLFT